jgi:hypothetical protein
MARDPARLKLENSTDNVGDKPYGNEPSRGQSAAGQQPAVRTSR